MESLSNIYIPFQFPLKTGENQFTIPLPRNQLKEDYQFSFTNLTLAPDIFNKEAQVRGFDSDLENEFEYYYPFQLEYTYSSEYSKNESYKYVQKPGSEKDNSTTLVAINKFFEGNKPAGQMWPSVIFDWSNMTAIEAEMDPNEFNYDALKFLYDRDTDDPSLHDWLPPGSRMPGLNNWQFPINPKDPMTLPTTHVRMHLGPNVEIGFSNDALLNAFGFTTNQYKPKASTNAQIKFSNPHPTDYKTIVAEKPVGTMVPSANNKITLYVLSKKVRSPEGVLTTKRGHLIKPNKLAEDYTRGFSEMATKSGHSLKLDYDSTNKKFVFTYPTTPGVKTDIYLDPEVSKQLGFPNGTYKITQGGSEPSPLEDQKDITDFIKTAVALVYDVGMANVYLQDDTNFQTLQFTDNVMATLEPQQDGTMKMACNIGDDVATAYLSYFAVPQLVFVIKRFSEAGTPVPLSLPCGSYIRGQIVGKKYKRPTRMN